MNIFKSRVVWIAGVSLLVACAPEPSPPTAVGEPMGTVTKATIGASGGSVQSSDSLLKVEIPEGALTADTEISIQPITNTAHGAAGIAYRLTPDGQKFAKPVTLRFTYTDDDVLGSAPGMLVIVTQNKDRGWDPVLDGLALDKNAKTLTVTTTHFTDWGKMRAVDIVPARTTVERGQTASPYVQSCFKGVGDVATRTAICGHLEPTPAARFLKNWSINGVTGGNSTVGTITGDVEFGRYVAPDKVPDPKIVLVTVDATNPFTGVVEPLIGRIEIVDNRKPYLGTFSFEFTGGGSTATATIDPLTFDPDSEAQDVRTYKAKGGSMTVSFNDLDCNPVSGVSLPITDGALTLYTSKNSAFPNQYFFNVIGQGPVTMTCNGTTATTMRVVSGFVGICNNPPPFQRIDGDQNENHLKGSGPCNTSNITSSSWDLIRNIAP